MAHSLAHDVDEEKAHRLETAKDSPPFSGCQPPTVNCQLRFAPLIYVDPKSHRPSRA